MAKLFRDSSVLNQFGSPSINSNTFANRPAFGQSGRLFISTDTLAIFRDTGTSWDNLTDNPGNIGTLEEVTTNGNTTTKGIFAGSSGTLTAGRLLEVKGKSLLTDTTGNVLFIGLPSITPNNSTLDVYGYTVLRNSVNTGPSLGPLLYSQYELNYAGTSLSGFANSIFAQDIYNVSASTTVASTTQSGTSLTINTYKFSNASTITFTQPAGTIRAASALTAYSQFQNTAAGTITHAAGITILGVENLGGSGLTINNNYQLLINASDEFVSTATVTNRWGIYQGGVNDVNYFAGNVNIGNNNPSNFKLDVTGTNIFRVGSGILTITEPFAGQIGFSSSATPTANNIFFRCNGSTTVINIPGVSGDLLFQRETTVNLGTFFGNGNFVIGSTPIDTGRKLVVNGNIEVITTVSTGAHTPSVNHLPIYVNNVLYYLQLLN